MGDIRLEKVLEQVKALTPEQQRQLQELLRRLLARQPAASPEEEFEQELVELGLLSEVKPPVTDLTPYQNRKPLEVKGKPLSEVIIEERR